MQLGYWAGQVLKSSHDTLAPVIIGQDSRNSSDMLAMAIAAGLTASGLDVWQLGLCPTPCVAYLTRKYMGLGGIMISASHNPPEDNGIKFFTSQGTKIGATLSKQIEAGLRGELLATPAQSWGKYYYQSQLVQEYAQNLLQALPWGMDFQGMRIVLDLAWGAAVEVAPAVFKALGAEVICLHQQADGDRINVNCGSTHLQTLKAAVQEHQADLGFAFDGDADRLMGVDAEGRVVDGDYILYFWGKALKNSPKLPDNLIIGTVMANLGFERAWQDLGGSLLRTPVGDTAVQAQMWETGAMLGGEQSGHILCHHYGVSGDGIQTALHLTALVKQSGLSLAQMMQESFQPYPQILRNVRLEDGQKRRHWQECEPLQKAIQQAELALGNQGRILVRASGTEPLIRVMVESKEAQAALYWTDYLVQAVEKYVSVQGGS
jgi:phosphoglucosamine mutase